MKIYFTRNLKELRKDNNLTQMQLSKKLNIGISTYRNWESGISEPPLSLLADIAKFYDVSVDYLLGLTDY